MRKKLRKLTLSRETLSKLDPSQLQQAAGADTFVSAEYTNCVTCSTPTYCGRRCFHPPSSPQLTACPGCTGNPL